MDSIFNNTAAPTSMFVLVCHLLSPLLVCPWELII